jgi:beta-glucosidase
MIDAINDSDIALTETIFLFLRDPVASVARPMLELKCWRRVALPARSARTVVFSLVDDDFAFPDANMIRRTEPGLFEIFVGFAADPDRLHAIVLRRDPSRAPDVARPS